ncbi:MAG TPA: anthranilate phosphoribosyltransferase [Acidobacteriota bacterium]|nr:anthranilate phosphoribosyltransferase [Acidobacteriota bacterium]
MLRELTRQARAGEHLSARQAEGALDAILSQPFEDAEIADLLVALADKGEHPQEITGFARAMRRHALRMPGGRDDLVDTAGTGGGGDTFNVSTTAAFVIAGAGVAVAKHGNRAVTSRSGSADVLETLGVKIDHPPELTVECLQQLGVAFFFAPAFHPAMARVAGIRSSLGRRTIFNLLGPLTNPMGAPCQVVGVFAPELTETLAWSLASLGCRRAWVVHSKDGLDEISPAALTRVSEVEEKSVRNFDFDPRDYGIEDDESPLPRGGDPQHNASITLGVLEGRLGGRARQIVLLNAAAAIALVEEEGFEQALDQAAESLDSGAALDKLRRLIQATQTGDLS